jgi:hypothetical protein
MLSVDDLLTAQTASDSLRLNGRQWLNEHYGGKAAGLASLPIAWVPEYVAIPASSLSSWFSAGRDNLPPWLRDLDSRGGQVLTGLVNKRYPKYIVRSSAAAEWLAERGRYKSLIISLEGVRSQL